jgi:hypothetical protein
MNGKLDFPLLQTLRLSTPRANIARPGATPKVRLTGVLQNRNPIRPIENRNPPERRKVHVVSTNELFEENIEQRRVA